MKRLKVRVVVEPDGEGFHAYCPAFKGLHVDGRSQLEALDRAGDAVSWYLSSLEKHREPLPIGDYCEVDDEETLVADDKPSYFAFMEPRSSTSLSENVEVLCYR